MSRSSPRPHALLFGGGITVLGAMRALHDAGVQSFVVGDEDRLVRRSRWYEAAPAFTGDHLEDYLQSLPWERAVLMPCSDDSLSMVARLSDSRLGFRFPSSLPSENTLLQLIDKGRFAALLRAADVPHPTTLEIDGVEDPAGREFQGFFLKPRDSQSFMRRFGRKALWPESREHFIAAVEELVGEGVPVVAQEYIPGPASNHYFIDGFVDVGGTVRACLVRRRLRMYPPRFGNSSFMVSVPPSEAGEAIESIRGLLAQLEYRGVFSAEFKKDPRDGVFKLLEVNARPWWFVEFAAACGVNVMEMAYRDALGEPVRDQLQYAVGKHFIHSYYDISACLREAPSRFSGILLFLKSFPGSNRPVLRWDDPLPGIGDFKDLSFSFVRRRLGRGGGS